MKLYFAYGANLNIQGMIARCPDAVKVRSHYLEDHRLIFSGVASIQPAPGESVAGAIWSISDSDEKSLDSFEGYPYLYRKEIVVIDGAEVMYYRMNSEPPQTPSANYLMTIAEGYQNWNLDIAYLRDAVNTTQEEAHDLHWSTSNQRRNGKLATVLEDDLCLESGDDLRWLRDDGRSYRDADAV